MRTKIVLTVATILVLVIGVAAIGSNMGFKIAINLVYDGNTSTLNWVSLPFFVTLNGNSSPKAADVKADIGLNCTGVTHFDISTHTYKTYIGGVLNNFTLAKGESVGISVNANTTWVVVGSHDPSASLTLTYDGNTSTLNWVSVPYHTTALKASDLKTQIGSTCTGITHFDISTHTYKTYIGGVLNNWTLVPGQGVGVSVNSTGSWVPAHY